MEELDFSDEACIERYVNFAYFDEDAGDTITGTNMQKDGDAILYWLL